MKKDNSSQKNLQRSLEVDFQSFLSNGEMSAPSVLSESVFEKIQIALNPSPFKVFGKIAAVQGGVGFFTLLFCPQFGIALTSSHGIMPYLMQYGENICMLGCGALFTGASLFVSSLLLSPEEVVVLKKNRTLELIPLVTLSIGAFLCLGTNVLAGFTLAWIVGALIGGGLALETGWQFRRFYYLQKGFP